MINITYYKVWDVFTVDGRGPPTEIGKFTNERDANEWARGKGNYNGDAVVSEINLNIAESIEEHAIYTQAEARQKALNKLNAADRIALGIT